MKLGPLRAWRSQNRNARPFASLSLLAFGSVFVPTATSAQTLIVDGNDTTVSTQTDDEEILSEEGVTSLVTGAPVVRIRNEGASFFNAGDLRSPNAAAGIAAKLLSGGGAISNSVSLPGDGTIISVLGESGVFENTGSVTSANPNTNGVVYIGPDVSVLSFRNVGADAVIEVLKPVLSVDGRGRTVPYEPQVGHAVVVDVGPDNLEIDFINSGTIIGGQSGTRQFAFVPEEFGDTIFEIEFDPNIDRDCYGFYGCFVPCPSEFGCGDGVRFGSATTELTSDPRVLTGSILNSGTISTSGDVSVHFVDGVSFRGTFVNDEAGLITAEPRLEGSTPRVRSEPFSSGTGIRFGVADHSGATLENYGAISGEFSAAVAVDGNGVTINNHGEIKTLGGVAAIVSGPTSQNFELNNTGTIAGRSREPTETGFLSSPSFSELTVAIQLTIDGVNRTEINNFGLIDGDVILTRPRRQAVSDNTQYVGRIYNAGTIEGIVSLGSSFGGSLINDARGRIFSGTTSFAIGSNGGNGGEIRNAGTIEGIRLRGLSRSGGSATTIVNSGLISGASEQRFIGDVPGLAAAITAGRFDSVVIRNLTDGVIDPGENRYGLGVGIFGGSIGRPSILLLENTGLIHGRSHPDLLNLLPEEEREGAAGVFIGGGVIDPVLNLDGLLTNQGVIIADEGAAIQIDRVNFVGEIVNSGSLIGTAVIDASAAYGSIRFTQLGGAFESDFIGSSFEDSLRFAGGETLLAANIRNNVSTRVESGAGLAIIGERALSGNLSVEGALRFTSGARLSVDGDVTLADGSHLILDQALLDSITPGSPLRLIDQTGVFTNNGAELELPSSGFLLDIALASESASIIATARDLGAVSSNASINSFGAAITSATNAGLLNDQILFSLNSVESTEEFETQAIGLLSPSNVATTREFFQVPARVQTAIQERATGASSGRIWGNISSRRSERNGDALSSARYDADSAGMTLGADLITPFSGVGGATLSYANIKIDHAADAGSTDVDAYRVGGYAVWQQDAWFASTQAGYTFGSARVRRSGLTDVISGDYDVSGPDASVVTGLHLDRGVATFSPHVGARFARLSSDAFTETGGLNLAVDAEDTDFFDVRAGLNADFSQTFKSTLVAPKIRAAIVYDALAEDRVTQLSINGDTPFEIRADALDEVRLEFGVGITLLNRNGATLSVDYDGEASSNYRDHGGRLSVKLPF